MVTNVAQSAQICMLCRSQLVQAKEESVEMGGYFICNGIERIIRMLIQQRRHYIMALRRSSFHKRGKEFTDAATAIRYGYAALADLSDTSSLPSWICLCCKAMMLTIKMAHSTLDMLAYRHDACSCNRSTAGASIMSHTAAAQICLAA